MDVELCLKSVKEDSNDLKRKIIELEEAKKKDEPIPSGQSGGPLKSPCTGHTDPKVTGFFNMKYGSDRHTHTHTHTHTCTNPQTDSCTHSGENPNYQEHTASFLNYIRRGSQEESDDDNPYTSYPNHEKIHNMSREELETKFNILRNNNYKKVNKNVPKLSKALLTPAAGQLPSEGIAVMAGIAGIYEKMEKQEKQQHTQNLYMSFVSQKKDPDELCSLLIPNTDLSVIIDGLCPKANDFLKALTLGIDIPKKHIEQFQEQFAVLRKCLQGMGFHNQLQCEIAKFALRASKESATQNYITNKKAAEEFLYPQQKKRYQSDNYENNNTYENNNDNNRGGYRGGFRGRGGGNWRGNQASDSNAPSTNFNAT
eukprot:GHVR01096590.1.p1 GENE.GHVR01096590.1~~GHVR01096590.1.p1  ORF type:complete len:369 (+),score=55.34 GHVR01096590.1:156-1262(+)